MPLGESLQDCVCWVSHEDQRLVSPVVRPLLPTTSDFCHIAQSRGFGSISYYCMAPLAAVPEPWWLWARELVVVKHCELPKELEHSASGLPVTRTLGSQPREMRSARGHGWPYQGDSSWSCSCRWITRNWFIAVYVATSVCSAFFISLCILVAMFLFC